MSHIESTGIKCKCEECKKQRERDSAGSGIYEDNE